MQRLPLSGKLIFDKIIISAIAVFFLLICFNYYPQSLDLILTFIPIIFGIGYITFYLPDYIEYDENNIYVRRRNSNFTIPLEDIYMVKMTMLSIGHRNIWKIKFISNGIEGDARFYARYFSSSFEDFISKAKSQNPKIVINNFSWSFDFDL